MLLRVMLRLGFSVVSDAERYPGGNGITSGSMIVIVAVIFVTTSRERLVRGLKSTNCASPAVKTRNNHYERDRTAAVAYRTAAESSSPNAAESSSPTQIAPAAAGGIVRLSSMMYPSTVGFTPSAIVATSAPSSTASGVR